MKTTLSTPHIRLLLVDGNNILRQWVTDVCESTADIEFVSAEPDIVVVDRPLANASIAQELKTRMPGASVIVLTDESAQSSHDGHSAWLAKDSIEAQQFIGAVRSLANGPQKPSGSIRRQGSRQAVLTDRVSKRQQQIIELVAAGKTNKEIAASLSLSPYTVKQHISKLLHILNFKHRSQLAALRRLESQLRD